MIKKLLYIILFTVALSTQAQNLDPLVTSDIDAQEKWVTTIMDTLTVDEKIGQLFMVAAYSNKDKKHEKFITDLIKNYHVGALIFFQDDPVKQAKLTNKYQALSKIPLLIGIDGEWGLNMRLKNTFRYPWNMTLGAIRDDKMIQDFGVQVGKHCKRMGIHINFAPVVDVNTNPENPIIGNRSFGENHTNVANKSVAFTKGIQSQNVMACAKHFPGHGDTSTDSHHTLPIVDFSEQRLDSIELYPYRKNFDAGLGSVMVAHLSVPSLELNVELPSSLSYNIVTGLLKERMGFEGLIITDAMNMKASANFSSAEEINLEAILAGNDLLDVPLEIPKTVALFKKALESGKLTEERLNESVKKILKTKYWAGLNNYKPIVTKNLFFDINTVEDKLLHRKLVENSITLLKSANNVFPIRNLDKQKIAYVKLGTDNSTDFVKMLKNYANIDVVSSDKLDGLIGLLKPYDLVIIGSHRSNANPWKSYKFENKDLVWLQEISREHKVILDVFASPYSLLQIKTFTNIDAVLVSYQNSKVAQEISAQMIFGALTTKGKLPVSIGNEFSEGHGLISTDLKRLSYTPIPEEVGMDSEKLKRIDSMFRQIISQKMAPGGQVLVARHGKVFFHKKYGYHTYDKKRRVKITDMYDLASLTKILGGLPMIMKTEENGLLKLDTKLSEMLPFLKGTNKANISLKAALSHTAKLKPWIPYYLETLDSITKKPLEELYRTEKSKKYSIKVAENFYLTNSYTDSIYKRIADVDQRNRKGYRYSGLVFYLFKKYIYDVYDREMDYVNDKYFYKPLGATTLTYNPLKKFKKYRIVPSEIDDYYRNQTLQGNVHDMGAAMMNGVSGNAGLFSNSNDVAKMMQMYLQKGYYGGQRYLKSETIDKFNKRYYADINVRRGLGFDKKQLDSIGKAASHGVSDKSFGHSGFTGTYTWADPETEIVYVFLSNRVYPSMKNNKLGKQNIRTVVQQFIVDAIKE
ncbi:MAG: beta-N-acetylglucosaminidase [Lutibacter sp.]|nr:MAG: beta-N-acetylglucosaminidase [Lutibacter sp.]